MAERKKAKIVPVTKVNIFENETNNYSNPSSSPRMKKIKVKYEIEVLRLERIPKKLANDGVIIYWKKKGAHALTTTKKETGQTVPIVLNSPVTNFQRQDNNFFSFSTRLNKEKNSEYLTPRKFINFGVQVERVKHSHKKQKLGTVDVLLNDYAKDGSSSVVTLELGESSLTSGSSQLPPPVIVFSIKATWLKSDGELLVAEEIANAEVNYDTEVEEIVKSSAKKTSKTKRHKRSTKKTEFKEDSFNDSPIDTSEIELSEQDHSDGEFTVDEFESDMETVDNDENAFLTRKSSRRMKLGLSFDKLSKKSESSVNLIKRSVGHMTRGQISLHFRIEILAVKPLPANANNKLIFVTWRRGSKKKNTGQTFKTPCAGGVADFSILPSPSSAKYSDDEEAGGELRNSFDLNCTLYPSKNKPQSQQANSLQPSLPYEEKTIAFQVKKSSSSSGSSSIGHVIVNLAEFYELGTRTKSFPLILRGGGALMNSGSAKITSRELGTLKNQNDPILLVPMIELRIFSELKSDELQEEDGNTSGNLSSEEARSDLSTSSSSPVSMIGKEDKEIFGKPILTALLQKGERIAEVAPFITSISDEIINNSIKRQGLFRLAGRGSKIQEIIDLLNSGLPFEASEYGAHEIGDVLKRYIRSLPQPVFPLALYDQFLAIGEKLDQRSSEINRDEILQEISSLIDQFPIEHSALLRHLCYLLDAVANHAEENLMGYENLAVVFGPTLLLKNEDDPLRILCDNPKKIAVFKFILENWKSIWTKEFNWEEVDKKLEENYPPEVRMNKLKAQIEQLKAENQKINEKFENLEEKYRNLEENYNQSVDQLKNYQSDLSILQFTERAIYTQPLEYININNNKSNDKNNNNKNDKERMANDYQSIVAFQLIPSFEYLQSQMQIGIIRALISSITKSAKDQNWNSFWLATTLQLSKYIQDKSTNQSNDNILIDIEKAKNEKFSFDEIALLSSIDKYDDLLAILNVIHCHLLQLILRHFQSKDLGEMVDLILKETPITNSRLNENTSIIDPIMDAIFDHLILVLYKNYIYPSVIKQFAIKIFEYIAQSAIGSLISNSNLCTSKIGLRIKLNICQFEYWISSRLTPQSPFYSILTEATASLSPVTQAANFLVTASNFSSNFDAKDLIEFFSDLSTSQIISLLRNFKLDSNNAKEKEKFEKDRANLLRQFPK